jgi:hypothetical protein
MNHNKKPSALSDGRALHFRLSATGYIIQPDLSFNKFHDHFFPAVHRYFQRIQARM